MRRHVLAFALVGFSLGCGGEEEARSPQWDRPISAEELGQAELWKLELMLEDRASNDAIERFGPSSYSTYFAPDGSVIRAGVGEIQGQEAIHEAFMADIYSGALADLNWTPERAEVSRGGDQGYTVGVYWAANIDSSGFETSERGMYVRYWARQLDDTWKVELEVRNPVAEAGAEPDPTSGNGPVNRVPSTTTE